MIRCESQQNSNTKLRRDTPRSLPQLRQPKLHPAALPTSPPRPSSPHNLRQLRPKPCWARSSAAARIQLHAITHFIKRGCVRGENKTKQKGITASLKFYWERSRQLTRTCHHLIWSTEIDTQTRLVEKREFAGIKYRANKRDAWGKTDGLCRPMSERGFTASALQRAQSWVLLTEWAYYK